METSTSMPIGYRFRPTDEELVSHYLNHKLLGNDAIVTNVIADVDFLGSAPWDLPGIINIIPPQCKKIKRHFFLL